MRAVDRGGIYHVTSGVGTPVALHSRSKDCRKNACTFEVIYLILAGSIEIGKHNKYRNRNSGISFLPKPTLKNFKIS